MKNLEVGEDKTFWTYTWRVCSIEADSLLLL
jgi:hypothetical protein